MKNSLEGLAVLVTRPAHQAKKLVDAIAQRGGKTILFPTIDIVPLENVDEAKKIFSRLREFSWIIFVSINAVNNAIPLIQSYYAVWPPSVKVAAVGKTTAESLQEKKIPVDFFPSTLFNSEALIASSEFQNVAHQKILIVRGEGGRELLSTTLKARGAKIEEGIVYRREMPKNFSANLLRKTHIDIIVCTSNTGLENLISMMGEANRIGLLNKKLLVISDRMRNFAKTLGFKQVEVSQNATDEFIVSALYQFKE
jgi:uroporphyrinogen-III synthase